MTNWAEPIFILLLFVVIFLGEVVVLIRIANRFHAENSPHGQKFQAALFLGITGACTYLKIKPRFKPGGSYSPRTSLRRLR